MVHAIPNAVDASKFTPNPSLGRNNNSGRIKVVVISRLVYRKGIDLLVGIIPIVCKTFDHVDFIVGGDGPKRLALEEQVERHQLQERVEFLGAVPHHEVTQVLARGQVFVNCSLTESFCIALLEAASCGLFVVSTNVGGVSEVLPSPEMMYLSEPTIESLALHVSRAIHRQEEIRSSGNKNEEALLLWDTHERIKKMYSWNSVAQRTARVYDAVMNAPSLGFLERLARYKSVGHGRGLAGYLTCLVAMMIHFCVLVLEWWQPRHLIDVVPDICLTSSSQQDDDDNINDSVTMKHDDIISSLEGYSEIENKKRN
jgi:phosphatidylinositol glycan class A protein